jgi:uncharacterized membrane protein (DUF373 family)
MSKMSQHEVPLDGDTSLPSPSAFITRAALALVWSERVVFFAIGLLLFVAALALLKECLPILGAMFAGGRDVATVTGSQFLDVILLVLMVVELAYTVILSLRGQVLSPEPFLIIGLIAVIRRILVITVGETKPATGSMDHTIAELGILTVVVVVFVGSIVMLRVRPSKEQMVL